MHAYGIMCTLRVCVVCDVLFTFSQSACLLPGFFSNALYIIYGESHLQTPYVNTMAVITDLEYQINEWRDAE